VGFQVKNFSTLFFVLPDTIRWWKAQCHISLLSECLWIQMLEAHVHTRECNEYVCSVSQRWLWVSSLFPFKTNVVNHRKCSLDESPTVMMIIALSISILAVELWNPFHFYILFIRFGFMLCRLFSESCNFKSIFLY